MTILNTQFIYGIIILYKISQPSYSKKYISLQSKVGRFWKQIGKTEKYEFNCTKNNIFRRKKIKWISRNVNLFFFLFQFSMLFFKYRKCKCKIVTLLKIKTLPLSHLESCCSVRRPEGPLLVLKISGSRSEKSDTVAENSLPSANEKKLEGLKNKIKRI